MVWRLEALVLLGQVLGSLKLMWQSVMRWFKKATCFDQAERLEDTDVLMNLHVAETVF